MEEKTSVLKAKLLLSLNVLQFLTERKHQYFKKIKAVSLGIKIKCRNDYTI